MAVIRTVLDYWRLLTRYLPRGAVWRVWRILTTSTYTDGTPKPRYWFGKLLMGLAEELARVDQHWLSLAQNANPSTAQTLLSEWEKTAFGSDQAWTLKPTEQRQTELKGHLADKGGLSLPYWTQVIQVYGFGSTPSNGPWDLWWQVKCGGGITRFRAGTGRAGDRLVAFTSAFLKVSYTLWYWRPAGTSIWWTD